MALLFIDENDGTKPDNGYVKRETDIDTGVEYWCLYAEDGMPFAISDASSDVFFYVTMNGVRLETLH